MKEAVSSGNYEKASELRDQIREIEAGKHPQPDDSAEATDEPTES